jgi:hypothetical protein
MEQEGRAWLRDENGNVRGFCNIDKTNSIFGKAKKSERHN